MKQYYCNLKLKTEHLFYCIKRWYLFKFRGIDYINVFYASPYCICTSCNEYYIDHPMDKKRLSFEGKPYLHVLCNGDRIKL
jgi:hypothetical protein